MTRVLVIDDSDDFRKLALRWFQSYGIEAEGAADGVQDCAAARAAGRRDRHRHFHAEKEGIETIHELRREFPGAKIIAVTGYEPLRNYDVFEVARQAGAMKTFMKPFKFEDLVAAVRELTGLGERSPHA